MISHFLKQKQRIAVETIVQNWNDRGNSLLCQVISAFLSNLDPSTYVSIAADLLDLIDIINNGIIDSTKYFLNGNELIFTKNLFLL